MTYAVIRFGGKQFKVQEGTKITLERQASNDAEVILFSENDNILVGEEVLKDYAVELKKVQDARARKIRVGRFRSKSRYRKIRGHKQPISVFEVITLGKRSTIKQTEKAAKAIPEEKIEKKTKESKEEKTAVAKSTEKVEKKTKTKKAEKTVVKKKSTKKVPSSTSKKEAEAPKKRGRPAKKKEE